MKQRKQLILSVFEFLHALASSLHWLYTAYIRSRTFWTSRPQTSATSRNRRQRRLPECFPLAPCFPDRSGKVSSACQVYSKPSENTNSPHTGPNIVPYVNISHYLPTHLQGKKSARILTKRSSLPLPRKLPPPPNTPPIRTQKRAATILPNFVGLRFAVHNGKQYHEVAITEEMVGRKLGEYVPYVLPSLIFPWYVWYGQWMKLTRTGWMI